MKEMQQYLGVLRQLKDFDENLSREIAAKAYQEQERIRLEVGMLNFITCNGEKIEKTALCSTEQSYNHLRMYLVVSTRISKTKSVLALYVAFRDSVDREQKFLASLTSVDITIVLFY